MSVTTPTPYSKLFAVFSVLLLGAPEVLAHAETGTAAGLVTGLLHPVLGPDHLLAMVAVGLWGAQLGAPAIWVLPLAFPVVMALGGMLGIVGVELPLIEVGIAISALTLGIAVAFCIRAPLAVAAIVVSLFAIFHGHAHGTELPSAANPLSYAVGFVISTGLLHVAGILIGALIHWPLGERVVRAAGGLIAACGSFFLATSLGLVG